MLRACCAHGSRLLIPRAARGAPAVSRTLVLAAAKDGSHAPPAAAGAITPEEALRLLDARTVKGTDRCVKKVAETFVLPSGAAFTVVDYKTSSFKDETDYTAMVRRGGPESLLLRRGLAAIYSAAPSKGAAMQPSPLSAAPSRLHFLLAGLPKFGYEADQFTTPPDLSGLRLAESVFVTKENGEACHLAFFPAAGGKWHACVGSKNVHVVISVHSVEEARKDIAHYLALSRPLAPGGQPANPRISFAARHCELLLDLYGPQLCGQGGEAMRSELFARGETIVFEAIYDDHIVDYGGRRAAIALAITRPQLLPLPAQGLCDPDPFPRLRAWGLEVPAVDVARTEAERERLKRKYEVLPNSEGAVVYELFEGLPAGSTKQALRLFKHKNELYVLRRMARELVKRRASLKQWRLRFEASHVPVDGREGARPELQAEAESLLAFYCWLGIQGHLAASTPAEFARLSAKYLPGGGGGREAAAEQPPATWGEFVQRCFKGMYAEFQRTVPAAERRALADRAEKVLGGSGSSAAADAVGGASVGAAAEGGRSGGSGGGGAAARPGSIAVMLVGVPGSGKSTLRAILTDALAASSRTRASVVGINQDELGGSRKKFIAALTAAAGRAAREAEGPVVTIVDKCNHTLEHREEVYSRFSDVLVVVLDDDGGSPDRLLARIRSRGIAHPTLPFSTRVPEVLGRFKSTFEPVGEAEAKRAAACVRLDAFAPAEEKANAILDALAPLLRRQAAGEDGAPAAAGGEASSSLLLPRVTAESAQKAISAFQAETAGRALSVPRSWWAAVAAPEELRAAVQKLAPRLPGVAYKWDASANNAGASGKKKWGGPREAEEEYHVTLAFNARLSAKETQQYLDAGEVTLRCTELVYDSKCVALRVAAEKGSPLAALCRTGNEPHVTLGWAAAEGVKPVYAGLTLLKSRDAKRVPVDFTFKAFVQPAP